MAITQEELTTIAKELFTALDKDGSGFLEKTELHQMAEQLYNKVAETKEDMKPFNEEKFDEGFAKLDKSGDGKISFDEMMGVLTKFAMNKGLIKE